MIARATFDAAVVAEWKRRRTAFAYSQRWVWWMFWPVVALAPIPLLLKVVPLEPYVFVAPFLLAFVGLHLRFRHLHILLCPHCSNPPSSKYGRQPIWEVDCCPTCNYWLLNPRRGYAPADGVNGSGG
jgi:hypothetical protein